MAQTKASNRLWRFESGGKRHFDRPRMNLRDRIRRRASRRPQAWAFGAHGTLARWSAGSTPLRRSLSRVFAGNWRATIVRWCFRTEPRRFLRPACVQRVPHLPGLDRLNAAKGGRRNPAVLADRARHRLSAVCVTREGRAGRRSVRRQAGARLIVVDQWHAMLKPAITPIRWSSRATPCVVAQRRHPCG